MLRITHLVSLLLLLGNLSLGQSTENPFELRSRLPETTAVAPTPTAAETVVGNPFELRPRLAEPAPAPPPAVRVALRPEVATVDPSDTDAAASASSGPLFLYQGGLLLLTTLLLIVSQRYVSRIIRSLWNEEMMRSLYRDRTTGVFGRFLAGYGIHVLSLSLFIFLLARHAGWLGGDRFGAPVGQIIFVVAGLIGLRHFALSALGHVFPIWNETSRYSFGIMILNIAVGLALIPANLLVAYVPPELTGGFVYGGIALLAAGYLLRALWGLRIAQPYLFRRFFHFFLYLCAVEIAPAVVLYKLFTNGL